MHRNTPRRAPYFFRMSARHSSKKGRKGPPGQETLSFSATSTANRTLCASKSSFHPAEVPLHSGGHPMGDLGRRAHYHRRDFCAVATFARSLHKCKGQNTPNQFGIETNVLNHQTGVSFQNFSEISHVQSEKQGNTKSAATPTAPRHLSVYLCLIKADP